MNKVIVQQHRIRFVIGRLMCNSTLRRALSRICGTAEQLLFGAYPYFPAPSRTLTVKNTRPSFSAYLDKE